MSSTAAIDVAGPLDAVRDALLAIPGAEMRPPGETSEVVRFGEITALFGWDGGWGVTQVVIGGGTPDQDARWVYDRLIDLVPFEVVLFEADTVDELARRGDVTAA